MDLRVDEGSVVRKGQVLFVIDTVPYKAALKVAETNVEVAKASTETARLTAENKRELQRRDIISEYDGKWPKTLCFAVSPVGSGGSPIGKCP